MREKVTNKIYVFHKNGKAEDVERDLVEIQEEKFFLRAATSLIDGILMVFEKVEEVAEETTDAEG